jgi:ribonuclease HI
VQPTTSTQWSHVPNKNQIWSVYFDGSKSKEGAGAGCVIIDPSGNKTLIACRLEFECTNNTTEYEALLQGLRKALDMNIQNLVVFGDSKSWLDRLEILSTVYLRILKATNSRYGI